MHIAWGINNGILDEKDLTDRWWKTPGPPCWPRAVIVELLGYVQDVGAEPGKVYAEKFTWYGNGGLSDGRLPRWRRWPRSICLRRLT